MRKKNLVKLCVTVAAVALIAAGCGNKQETPGTESASVEQEGSDGAETGGAGGETVAAEESLEENPAASKEENTVGTEKAAGVEAKEQGVFEKFTATDLDGNEVTQEIFKDYDVTMINVWATFCGPCLSEMPELGELSGVYEEKGLQIVGIVSDVLETADTASTAQIEEAKSIVEKTKASYLHIVPTGELAYSLLPQVPAVPTTVFVDKDGKQIGSAVVGARDKKNWIKLMDEKLEEVKAEE